MRVFGQAKINQRAISIVTDKKEAKRLAWNRWYHRHKEQRHAYKRSQNATNEKCRVANQERNRRYRETHSEELRRYMSEYRKRKESDIKKAMTSWRKENAEHLKLSFEKYKPRRNALRRQLRRTNPSVKIRDALRCRLAYALRNQCVVKSSSFSDLLGCSIENFKIYLESKFEVGMSCGNYGFGIKKWHIDHIVPCAIFDLSKPEHQKRCFHFSNLQPMWQPENVRKGKRSDGQMNLV